jgi:hypothetical protein
MKIDSAHNQARSLPSHDPADAIPIDTNRHLLNRYRFVSHETIRILAGWLPKTERFELKCEMGRTIWESALQVNAYYLRLREIQSPAFQKPKDSQLVRMMNELRHAPDEFALILSFQKVILPDLIRALENHETATFPNSDLPSVHAIRHSLLDLRAQADRLRTVLADAEQAGRFTPDVHAWEKYVRQLLRAAGGIDGGDDRPPHPPIPPTCRTEFRLPLEAGRDERFTQHTRMVEAAARASF